MRQVRDMSSTTHVGLNSFNGHNTDNTNMVIRQAACSNLTIELSRTACNSIRRVTLTTSLTKWHVHPVSAMTEILQCSANNVTNKYNNLCVRNTTNNFLKSQNLHVVWALSSQEAFEAFLNSELANTFRIYWCFVQMSLWLAPIKIILISIFLCLQNDLTQLMITKSIN